MDPDDTLPDIEPLYFELSNRTLQLVGMTSKDPSALITLIESKGWKVVRVKHTVSARIPGEDVVYYEAHVRFHGELRADLKLTSRDLYRHQRWYMTRRSPKEFDAKAFERLAAGLGKQSRVLGSTYMVCIEDTNPSLDDGWYMPSR